MHYLELLAFYHWIIIGLGFFLLEITRIGGISMPGTIVAIVLAIVTYLYPDIPWWEQVWAFVMLTALVSIIYLGRKRDTDPPAGEMLFSATVPANRRKDATITPQEAPSARSKLNSRTLALYDPKDEGQYQRSGENHYSEPEMYNFLYGEGVWPETHSGRFEEEMDQLEAALQTPWADKLRGTLPLELTQTALRMLRDGKLAENAGTDADG